MRRREEEEGERKVRRKKEMEEEEEEETDWKSRGKVEVVMSTGRGSEAGRWAVCDRGRGRGR